MMKIWNWLKFRKEQQKKIVHHGYAAVDDDGNVKAFFES